jgi:hypothetical protein
MGCVCLQGQEIRVEPVRSLAAVPPALTDPAVQLADLGDRVGVLLGEADPRAHVEDVTDRGTAVTRLLKLRDVVRHQPFRVEVAALDQDGGHAPHDRFAQRQQGVEALGVAVLAVGLEHDATVLQHHTRVGEGVGQDRGHPR